ncbi:MAG TPA: ATP-binding cassette domain-containing protein [Dehalococcoidia bacterium]|nr:ATP-binding cassette domain-containing protein [Dehalococcoidia bacterium]
MIDVQHLTKNYGDFVAVEDISFFIAKGEIVGFLGPNGAGKTTTMRILTGFMPPTSGKATIAGYDVFQQSLEARQHIGYLPETVPLYTDMTVRAYLDFQATLHAMRNPHKKARIDEIIERMRLEEYDNILIGKLSKGYRQRVGIAQAVLHEPDVLILDEPTIGIDPIQVVETRQLIKELGQDHTIILSSHILPEVSMVCQRVLIIDEGRLVAADTTEGLSSRLGGPERVQMVVKGPMREVAAVLRDVGGVHTVEPEDTGTEGTFRFLVECRAGRDVRPQLAAAVVQRRWDLLELHATGLSLEDIFLQLTTKEELEVHA